MANVTPEAEVWINGIRIRSEVQWVEAQYEQRTSSICVTVDWRDLPRNLTVDFQTRVAPAPEPKKQVRSWVSGQVHCESCLKPICQGEPYKHVNSHTNIHLECMRMERRRQLIRRGRWLTLPLRWIRWIILSIDRLGDGDARLRRGTSRPSDRE